MLVSIDKLAARLGCAPNEQAVRAELASAATEDEACDLFAALHLGDDAALERVIARRGSATAPGLTIEQFRRGARPRSIGY